MVLDYFQVLAWLWGRGWEEHFDHDAWFSNITEVEALKRGPDEIRSDGIRADGIRRRA